MQETWVRSLSLEDPLEKEMATHSSIPAWTIPWTEEPGRLQSMESQRIGHDLVTKNKFQAKGHLVSTEACVGNGDCSVCSLSTRIYTSSSLTQGHRAWQADGHSVGWLHQGGSGRSERSQRQPSVTGNIDRRVAAANRRVPLLGIPELGFYGNPPLTCISHNHSVSAEPLLSMHPAISETRRCGPGLR